MQAEFRVKTEQNLLEEKVGGGNLDTEGAEGNFEKDIHQKYDLRARSGSGLGFK